MIYDLAGVVRLGDEPRASAFLIPFFRSRTSNLVFAQDLDEEHRIARFLVFDPFAYTVLDTPLPPLSRTVGDLGLMAFVRRDHTPIVGDVDQVLAALRATKFSRDRSPFFEIDAYGLTGQVDRMRGALRRARRALGDGPIAVRWSATEAKLIRHPRRAPAAEPDSWSAEIESLAADFGHKNWPKRWVNLWANAKLRDRLVDLGADYLERSGQPVTMTGRVLVGLLRQRWDLLPARVLRLADDWLVACARVQPINATLPRVWRTIAQADDTLSADMVERGLTYLRESVEAGRVTAIWASVAAMLRKKRPRDTDIAEEIFRLSRKVLISGQMPTIALRPVIKSLLGDRTDFKAIEVLEDWVKADLSHSNAWIDAFLAVLDVRGGDHELLDVGLTWLEEDPGALRRWKQVYSALEDQVGPSPTMHAAARNWLLCANRKMLTWPEVAIEVLGRGSDALVEAAARDWVEQNPLTPMAFTLEAMLAASGANSPRQYDETPSR